MQQQADSLITPTDDADQQASCFNTGRRACFFRALCVAFLTILAMTPTAAYGGEDERATQTASLMREQYEQRKERFIAQQLEVAFTVPEIDTLHKPNFKAPVNGTLERARASKGITFSRSFTRDTSARALLLLSEDRNTARANELFGEVCHFYLNCDVDHLVNRDSFYWATEAYLHLYHKFSSQGTRRPGALAPETERAFLAMIWRYVENSQLTPMELLELGKEHDGYWYDSSENHWCMEVVTLWSFCEILADVPEYAGRRLPEGKTPAEMADYLTDYLKIYIRGRAAKGFLTEIASGGYNSRMLAMFSSIQDYAKDQRLREMARDIQDLYWAFWAEEQIAGERGGGKVRQRSWKGLIPNKESVSLMAWMYFGAGNPGVDAPPMIINTIYSSYYPRDIVQRLVTKRKRHAPYAIVQRRVGKNMDNAPTTGTLKKYYDTQGHVLRYSWCEESFILGTCMRPPLEMSAWPIGSTQSWHHGLIIEGDGLAERVVPKVLLQDTFNEQYAVQSKGTLICRRLPSERNGKAPMGIFISMGLVQYMQREGQDVFINSPKAHVAIRFVGGGHEEFDLSVIPEIHEHGIYLKNDDMYSPVILEVAAPDMFADFAAFKEAVLSQDAEVKKGRLEYATIYGDTLTMFTTPDNIPLINGEEIDYHPDIVYQSPFIRSQYGSGIIDITVGEEALTLDFN